MHKLDEEEDDDGDDEEDAATRRSGDPRGNTIDEPIKPVTIVIGAGFGANGCNFDSPDETINSRSVFLLFTIISSFLRLILNFKLFNMFSGSIVGFVLSGIRTSGALSDFNELEQSSLFAFIESLHPVVMSARLHVPSRFARIITVGLAANAAGSGLGGGVPSNSNLANSQVSERNRFRGGSSSSSSDG